MLRGYIIPIGGAEEKFRDPVTLNRLADLFVPDDGCGIGEGMDG